MYDIIAINNKLLIYAARYNEVDNICFNYSNNILSEISAENTESIQINSYQCKV